MNELFRKSVLQVVAVMVLAFPSAAHLAKGADLQTLAEVYEIISYYHVSGMDSETLGDAAIEGMLKKLNDPYTRYIPPEEAEQFSNSMEQQYVGIGIRVGTDDDGFFVEEVFPDSPASEGGLQARDYIVEVDGNSTAEWELERLTGSIRGEEGTVVQLKLRRGDETIDVTLTRKAMEVPVITAKWLGQGIGYMELSNFTSNAGVDFGKELEQLKEKGLRGLVLDLRGNPGGFVHTAQAIAGHMLESGVLMHTKDRYGEDDPVRITGGKKADFRIIVLVDENSASASEVLAGALQDYGAGKLVGTKTYGKGSVQSLVNLSNGGVLRVTIEEYLTPKFRKVDGVGLTPDREVSGKVPQLLIALHEAGMQDIRLTGDRYGLELNGASFGQPLDFKNENGKVYVPSRTLAALVDWDIRWNASESTVELEKDGRTISFSGQSGQMKLEKGTSYLDVEAFQKHFPDFHWEMGQGDAELTIGYKKGS